MKPNRWRLARTQFGAVLLSLMLGSLPVLHIQAALLITEFMAVNDSTLKDDLGVFSDWIEIYNDSSEAVNLNGYFLTDDLGQLTQWSFPATNLPPRRFLLVFASGSNRRVPGAPLHTNFKLSGGGESLALIKPDGVTVLSQYAFGPQTGDVSIGLACETPNKVSLLPAGTAARVWVPTAAISSTWANIDFNTSAWLPCTPAIGFETIPPRSGQPAPVHWHRHPGPAVQQAIRGLPPHSFHP